MRRDKGEIIQVGIRVPEGLRANMEKAAKQRGVSMNAEFIARIERSFQLYGLLGEVLEGMHGTDMALGLMTAHRAGMLTFSEQNKQQMKDWLNKWVDSLPTKEAKK